MVSLGIRMKILFLVFIVWNIPLIADDKYHYSDKPPTIYGGAHTGSYGNDPTDYGWGWAYNKCKCNKSKNPCCSSECRYQYCLKQHTISPSVFPPECVPFVQQFNKCNKITVNYTDNAGSTKEANGINKGSVNIKINTKSKNPKTKKPIVIYKVKVKQGIFVGNGLSSVSFTLNDSLGKKLQYKTYDCNKESIKDKEFDTLTLAKTTQLGSQGVEELVLKRIKIPFICQTPYFTATTTNKTISTISPIKNYRGISKELQSYEEDKETYYIYIDAKNAKIVQYHVDAKSTRKIHKEAYKLNMQSCQYEIETEDKLIKNMGGRDILKSEDAGWGFDDDTKIYVNLPSSQKDLSFTWGRLRQNGYYSKTAKYQKKIPQIVKSMMGKVNNMATLFRNKSKNSKDMEILKALYDFPGTPKDVQCGGKVSMETLLIPPLDGLQDPDVVFKINIRPSTKGEIKILKNKMHIQ